MGQFKLDLAKRLRVKDLKLLNKKIEELKMI